MCIILAFVGMPGSSKTQIAKEHFRTAQHIELSNAIANELLKTGKALTPSNFSNMAKELRDKYGPYVILERSLTNIPSQLEEGIVIIDGLRTRDEWRWLIDHFENSFLVAIHSSPKVRYERLLKNKLDAYEDRNNKQPPMNIEECEHLDSKNLELGVGDLISIADYVIINDEFQEYKLAHQVRQIINHIELRIKADELDRKEIL